MLFAEMEVEVQQEEQEALGVNIEAGRDQHEGVGEEDGGGEAVEEGHDFLRPGKTMMS